MSSNPSDLAESEEELYLECATHGPWLRSVYNQERKEWNPVLPIGCPECRREAQQRKLMDRAAIPPRFAHCTFDTFRVESHDQQAAFAVCRQYAADFRQMHTQGACLVLRGNIGTGKNHLACAIARQVSEQGYSCLMLTVAEIIQRIRATWDRQTEETQAEITSRFGDVDLLILDEVGRQYGSESEKIILFQVIDARYRAMRPTIVLSNLAPEEIADYLGAAAYDRLRENGGKLVHFDWASYRWRCVAGSRSPEAPIAAPNNASQGGNLDE
jgi:DNA replication protein DnaC